MVHPIPLKTSLDVQRMKKPSRLIERIFRDLKGIMKRGLTTGEIDRYCAGLFDAHHATSSQKGYRGFPASVCVSPNSVAVHGVPGDLFLTDGDIVTVDITLNMDGWHSDAAWTYLVGKYGPDKLHLLKAAWRCSMAGIMAAKAGNRLGDVGDAIQRTARKFGCSVLDDFAGHGIGENLHEEPIVANTGTRGVGQPIVPGMVFTIEPILCLGRPEVKTLEDGWTVVTRDGSPTAQFEHTIAIFGDRTEILTLTREDIHLNLDLPPFF